MDMPLLEGTFELTKHQSASAQIYEFLRKNIVSLAFAPGTLLPRPELARFFNASLTPVRDALLRLEEDGLVAIFPQHATRVSKIDIGSARNAQFLRLALELEVARTLASQNDGTLHARLKSLLDLQQGCWDRNDLDGFVAADQEFHRQMFCAANVERLWHTMRARSGNMDRLRRLNLPLAGKAGAVLQQHGEIVDAIGKNDPHLAEQRVRSHLAGTLSQLSDLRAQYPHYLRE
jgi:GntR family transcriptional regulator, rspAB operon transcriptional repressor